MDQYQYVYVDLCAAPVSPKPLYPFDPYDKVPREIRKMLRSQARSIYHKKRTSALSGETGGMPPASEWRQNPHFHAYMDHWAELYV